jgi:hypothetical protein
VSCLLNTQFIQTLSTINHSGDKKQCDSTFHVFRLL